jgi:hypothetical protein
MTDTLYKLRVFRRQNGVAMPAQGTPDVQADAVCAALREYLVSLQPAAPAAHGTHAYATATAQALATFLRAAFPGTLAQAVDEYVWYVDPETGMRIKVCISEEVVVSQALPAGGGPAQPVDPTLVISFQNEMY